MFTYYIAGVSKCQDFGHATYVAEKLKRSLPDFSYEVIVKTEEKYQNWVENFCREQKWENYSSPLIWKRLRDSSSPCQLIGGINEFFVLLEEYYAIDVHLDKRIKKKIAQDNHMRMKFIQSNQDIPKRQVMPRRVCITGAVYSTTIYLVSELLQLKQLHTEGGVTICLHHRDPKKYGDLIRIKKELSDAEFNIHGHCAMVVVYSLEEGLINCDLLIVIGTVKRLDNENQNSWICRHYGAMLSLASILDQHCPEKCKVMLMNMDLLCFNLNVLAENANKVNLYNFVGVTEHYGMETLPTISETTGIQMSDLHCPPVWGYVGMEKYVDIDHTIYRTRHHGESTGVGNDVTTSIPLDHSEKITKTHKYLHSVFIRSGDSAEEIVAKSRCEPDDSTQSDCPLRCLPEIRAALRLLSEWFGNENNTTISAAIYSDGTFGLPFGMFLSQPVVLENGEWKPNYNYPSPNENILNSIVSRAKQTSIEYNIGQGFSTQLRELQSSISELNMCTK